MTPESATVRNTKKLITRATMRQRVTMAMLVPSLYIYIYNYYQTEFTTRVVNNHGNQIYHTSVVNASRRRAS